MPEESKSNLLIYKREFKDEIYDEFIHEINPQIGKQSSFSFNDCIFKESCIFDNINAKELVFHNCKFEKEFFLTKSKIAIIGFTDCTFAKDFSLTSNSCSNFIALRRIKASKIKVNGEYNTFQIVSSIVENLNIGDINSKSSNKESKIEFLIENEIKELRIEPFSTFSHIIFKGSKYKDIHFEGTFNNRISFEGNIKVNSINFESSNFDKRIDFQEGDYNYIKFYRSNFNGLIHINDFNPTDVSTRDLIIYTLWMHSCNFTKDVSVQTSNIEHITLSNNNFNQLFNFNQCKDEIAPKKEQVMISMGGTNRGNIVIERAYFDITIRGVNFGNIFLKDSNMHTFYLTELENKGSITLTNIKSGNFFTIQDSTVGSLIFTNTDVNNFNEIVIANSNIEKVNFKKYPKKILSYSTDPKVGYGIKEKSKRTANLKDIYNQLKQIAKRVGDVDISNKYQSLEHKQLLLSKRFGFDSIVLFLNLISNNNGRSWFVGVLFTLLIAFLFFLLYLKTLDISFNYTESFKDYILFISSFPKLQLEKYSELNSKWSISLVIWLSRIFISYGIYQTVAAFRKYGKT